MDPAFESRSPKVLCMASSQPLNWVTVKIHGPFRKHCTLPLLIQRPRTLNDKS